MKSKPAEMPLSLHNWRNWRLNTDCLIGYEFPLFSDANVIDEIRNFGPYSFFNCIAMAGFQTSSCRPVIVVRLWQHYHFESRTSLETSDKCYHGGDIEDEIAALMSIALGARFKAGSLTRQFRSQDDPMGVPRGFATKPPPNLCIDPRNIIIPSATSQKDMALFKTISAYFDLKDEAAIAFIKAARLFQEAIWIAESDPNLSWLLSVSAVETASTYRKTEKPDPVVELQQSFPELHDLLLHSTTKEVLKKASNMMSHRFGSSRGFLSFLVDFMPAPPENRPPVGEQFDFDDKEFVRNTIRKVYSYRSRNLHSGKPFPLPMCQSPHIFGQRTLAASEKISSLAVHTPSATWNGEDTPIFLHVFLHMVRGSLLRWLNEELNSHSPHQQ